MNNNKFDRVKRLEEEAMKSSSPYNAASNELFRLITTNAELSHSARAALDRLNHRLRTIAEVKMRDGGRGAFDEKTEERVSSVDKKIKAKDGEMKQVVETAEAAIKRIHPTGETEDIESKKEKFNLAMIRAIQDTLLQVERNGFNPRRQKEFALVAGEQVDTCRERGYEVDASVEEKLKVLYELIIGDLVQGDNSNYGSIVGTVRDLRKILTKDQEEIESKVKKTAI